MSRRKSKKFRKKLKEKRRRATSTSLSIAYEQANQKRFRSPRKKREKANREKADNVDYAGFRERIEEQRKAKDYFDKGKWRGSFSVIEA